jgi:hypothetical protein
VCEGEQVDGVTYTGKGDTTSTDEPTTGVLDTLILLTRVDTIYIVWDFLVGTGRVVHLIPLWISTDELRAWRRRSGENENGSTEENDEAEHL